MHSFVVHRTMCVVMYICVVFCFVRLLLTDVNLLQTFGLDATDRSVLGWQPWIVIVVTDFLQVCLLVDCLLSQQHASVSQGWICSDNCTCCHTEIEAADPTFYLTQSQYTDTGPTNPSTDSVMPGAWQGGHWSANFEVTGMTRPRKILS